MTGVVLYRRMKAEKLYISANGCTSLLAVCAGRALHGVCMVCISYRVCL